MCTYKCAYTYVCTHSVYSLLQPLGDDVDEDEFEVDEGVAVKDEEGKLLMQEPIKLNVNPAKSGGKGQQDSAGGMPSSLLAEAASDTAPWSKYVPEMVSVGLLSLYAVLYFVGKAANKKIADRWCVNQIPITEIVCVCMHVYVMHHVVLA